MTASRTSGDITFRPVTEGDLAMLAAWLRRPHWREWWGDPDTELGYIRDMIDGSDPTCEPFIFVVDGEPAGIFRSGASARTRPRNGLTTTRG